MTDHRVVVLPVPRQREDAPARPEPVVTERDYLLTRRRALLMELHALDRHLGIERRDGRTVDVADRVVE